MKLRARLLFTIVAVAVPMVLALALFAFGTARESMVEATYERTLERMEARGRERCEERPAVFLRRGRPGGRRGRPEGRGRRRRPGIRGAGRIVGVYSETFAPLLPRMTPLSTDLRDELADGEDTSARWSGGARPRALIAMRMPWDGPCAVIVVDRAAAHRLGPHGLARTLGVAALMVVITAAVALIALGPLVRRIRILTASVRAQASGGYEGDVTVRGADEVAELGRAFNEAGAEIRERIDELAARDRALTEFLQSTTHDVMVPLTVLQGHLSVLAKAEREGGDADPTRVRRALEEAHYIASLLRNLSAAARLEAGEPMLSRHDLDLRDVVERVISRHRPIARGRGVELVHAVPERPLRVHADSTLLEQAIGNLVHNAIRYNEEGGHVALVLEPSPEGFALFVKDDGPGIPAEELARVAERRFRGGAARQRSPTGLGLGLHIVRDVADKHGYELRFESPEEGGLTVHLRGALDGAASST